MLITEFGANWVRNKEPVAGNELYGKGMNRKVAIAITVVLDAADHMMLDNQVTFI